MYARYKKTNKIDKTWHVYIYIYVWWWWWRWWMCFCLRLWVLPPYEHGLSPNTGGAQTVKKHDFFCLLFLFYWFVHCHYQKSCPLLVVPWPLIPFIRRRWQIFISPQLLHNVWVVPDACPPWSFWLGMGVIRGDTVPTGFLKSCRIDGSLHNTYTYSQSIYIIIRCI